MKTGSSRRFKWYPTTYKWVSSWLPFTMDEGLSWFILIHSKGMPTWNSHIGCGVSLESSWWAHFHGRVKTYADWVWYLSKIGELWPVNSIFYNLLIKIFIHLPEDGGRGFSLKTRQVRRTESPRPFVCSRPTTFSVPPSLSRSPELSCVSEIQINLRQIAFFHTVPSILDKNRWQQPLFPN